MNNASLDRIQQRLVMARGGTVTAAPGTTWEISIPEDPEREGSPALTYRNTFKLESGRVTEIGCDAPLDRYTVEQALMVAGLHRDLASAIAREGVVFGAFQEVDEFLGAELSAQKQEGYVEV